MKKKEEEWISAAADLKFSKNIPWSRLSEELEKKTGLKVDNGKIRDRLRALPEYKEWQGKEEEAEPAADIHNEVLKELGKPCSIKDLAKKLKQSERIIKAAIDDLTEQGYNIIEIDEKIKLSKSIVPENNQYEENWNGEKIIKFGSVSDTHLCNKWQQLTFLNYLYDIFSCEGITTIYHGGDISDGFYKNRPGHIYELFKIGADEQAEYIINNYPERKGIITKFITGNHDDTHIMNGGANIGKAISKERKDMIYLGCNNAKISITPNCVLEVNHPGDGTAYALSYSIQKYMDSMTGGEKPNILLNAHHHKSLQLFYRNIHAFETGTTEAQTPFEKSKRIGVMMGGWIIEVHVDKEGTITRCKGEFVPLYIPKEHDY